MPRLVKRKIRIGIVGSEEAKFTPETKAAARRVIASLLPRASVVVSGGCHLGGIDVWAAEMARDAGIPVVEHFPRVRAWGAAGGYRDRNLLIVRDSDEVVCVTVRRLPDGFAGMTFDGCYHCPKGIETHVKSGGCWTAKQARFAGKPGKVVVV